MEKYHKVIGIDLGTTYSAVAVYDNYDEDAVIIPDRSEGRDDETTPSVISLDSSNLNRVIVGSAAKRNIAIKPQDTIIEVKREMGETFTQKTLKKYNASKYFKVNDPVQFFFAGEWYFPQVISGFTLMKMKEIAEKEIGEEIRDAVVTVPAYFKEKQRKATEEAALLAGLYPHQLIPEPTAAAICYGVDQQEDEKKAYLVYDLGGGTFDVSIIQVEGESIQVISTSGDSRLGGSDFDDAITNWAVEQLKTLGIDVENDQLKKTKIKERSEIAKIALSSFPTTTLDLSFLDSQKLPTFQLSREQFYSLIHDYLGKTKNFLDMAINGAKERKGIGRDDIDAILLVGGSSKIPVIKEMLLEYFGKEDSFVRSGVNPDTVVARGAAIMAQKFAQSPEAFDIGKRNESTLKNPDADTDLIVQGITEHTLGIGIQDNLVARIVDVGSNIPCEVKRDGFTNDGPTENIPVAVYQGEGKYTYENTLIGTLQIGPMESKPAKHHNFEVVFKIDENGLISMTIIHVNEGKTYEAQFEQKTGVGGDKALIAFRKKLLNIYLSSHTVAAPPQPVEQAGGSNPIVPLPVQPDSGVVPQPVQADPQQQPQQPVPPAPQGVPPVQPDPGVVPQPVQAQPQQQPQPPVPPVQPEPGAVPQPVQSDPGQQPQQPVSSVPPGVPPVQPDPGVVPQPVQAQPQQPPQQPVPQVQSNVPPVQPAAPSDQVLDNIVEPVIPVPDEFKQVVRRSKKLLLKSFDQKLLDALNTFMNVLNSGATEDPLEEAGDDLADAYDDARK